MEKKMENEMETLGPFKGVYREITPNIMEIEMSNIRVILGLYIGIMEKKLETTVSGLGFPKIRGT